MQDSLGQNINYWKDFWGNSSPESEIRMWDFYGGRPWILKYTPRFGKTIEAGCGLGRYVFYLSKLGIDIEGVDFQEDTIAKILEWGNQTSLKSKFIFGDVTALPYEDNSLSGYISLGVVEHFIEGPHKALSEAFRVLRPGGIAIITTPNVSFSILLIKTVKHFLHIKTNNPQFVQYWYTPKRLKIFVEQSGLTVVNHGGCDLLYPFLELRYNIENQKIPVWFANKFENTFLSRIGAQSITISVKLEKQMYCFFCGEFTAKENSIENFQVPTCNKCNEKEFVGFYRKNIKPLFEGNYVINPEIKRSRELICDFCNNKFTSSELFENFGFSKSVCEICLTILEVNIFLSNKFVSPLWRHRNQSY